MDFNLSKVASANSKAYSKAYDRHRSIKSSKHRALNVFLVVGDCVLVGLQVIFIQNFGIFMIVVLNY